MTTREEANRRVRDLLREVREPGAAPDAGFFDRKAAAFDAIADTDPFLADQAREMAQTAQARARELRGGR